MPVENIANAIFSDLDRNTIRPPPGRKLASLGWMRTLPQHPDPLVEASNWVALVIGTHLPFWPLYVLWAAGPQAEPSALLTAAMTPIFLLIPLLARRDGVLGRIAMLTAGIANTVFTIWVLGENTGTEFFLVPCAVLAAILFRHTERWLMVGFTVVPLAVWYLLQGNVPGPLHQYDEQSAQRIFVLNVISVGVLIVVFGWLQGDIYRRMERTRRLH